MTGGRLRDPKPQSQRQIVADGHIGHELRTQGAQTVQPDPLSSIPRVTHVAEDRDGDRLDVFEVLVEFGNVVDLVLDERTDAVRIEGAEDVVDYEVLDRDGRRLAVRQAKTRQATIMYIARQTS